MAEHTESLSGFLWPKTRTGPIMPLPEKLGVDLAKRSIPEQQGLGVAAFEGDGDLVARDLGHATVAERLVLHAIALRKLELARRSGPGHAGSPGAEDPAAGVG